jgi:hypothetical protein
VNFEDIKDKFREAFQSIAGKIKESPAWHQLMEKYADLPPQGQKIALAGAGFGFTLMMLLVPSCVLMTSSTNLQEFEDKKQLMRDLFRTHRTVSALPPAPIGLSIGELQNRASSELSMAGLQPDQLGGVMEFDNKAVASTWIPKSLEQKGVNVTVRKLNLQQVVDIGTRLQRIQSTAKMTGMEIRAQAADPHYFDVVYKIVAFNLPPEPAPKGGKK